MCVEGVVIELRVPFVEWPAGCQQNQSCSGSSLGWLVWYSNWLGNFHIGKSFLQENLDQSKRHTILWIRARKCQSWYGILRNFHIRVPQLHLCIFVKWRKVSEWCRHFVALIWGDGVLAKTSCVSPCLRWPSFKQGVFGTVLGFLMYVWSRLSVRFCRDRFVFRFVPTNVLTLHVGSSFVVWSLSCDGRHVCTSPTIGCPRCVARLTLRFTHGIGCPLMVVLLVISCPLVGSVADFFFNPTGSNFRTWYLSQRSLSTKVTIAEKSLHHVLDSRCQHWAHLGFTDSHIVISETENLALLWYWVQGQQRGSWIRFGVCDPKTPGSNSTTGLLAFACSSSLGPYSWSHLLFTFCMVLLRPLGSQDSLYKHENFRWCRDRPQRAFPLTCQNVKNLKKEKKLNPVPQRSHSAPSGASLVMTSQKFITSTHCLHIEAQVQRGVSCSLSGSWISTSRCNIVVTARVYGLGSYTPCSLESFLAQQKVDQDEVDERYWEILDEGWFIDWGGAQVPDFCGGTLQLLLLARNLSTPSAFSFVCFVSCFGPCGCCGLDHEGSSDTSDGPVARCLVFGTFNHEFP